MVNDLISEEIKYSVVTPVFNEEESIIPLFYSLKKTMDSLKDRYEIIFINDGSIDSTVGRLNTILKKNNHVRIINFAVNRGQGKAIEEGFRNVKGKIIITLDGDLQNDPTDIPRLISKVNQGFDLVCGWRYARCDTLIKKVKSKIGNFLQRRITHINLHDISCTMRAYRKEIIVGITFKGKYDFSILPYIISKKTKIKMTEVKIEDNYRKFGKTKYKYLSTMLGTIYDYLRLFFTEDV